MTKALMIQGTASGVGKSILSTGLCRILKRKGWSVAPFKSQNMSSNAYRLESGLEMAKAQAIAAWACDLEPNVDMNPILLKPIDGITEVVVQGRSIGRMDCNEYEQYKKHDAWIPVTDSYRRLTEQYDIIVLEGAGSPVELNMKDNDIANMNMARRIGAPVILVADIDRGGVFAHVKGTLSLFTDDERASVKGVIVNKCRGRMERFDDVKNCMEKIVGISVLGMVPYLDIKIEDEDSICDTQTGPKTEITEIELRQQQFDALAVELEKHLDLQKIDEIIEGGN
jgi:adenosylcobyric acid synthase